MHHTSNFWGTKCKILKQAQLLVNIFVQSPHGLEAIRTRAACSLKQWSHKTKKFLKHKQCSIFFANRLVKKNNGCCSSMSSAGDLLLASFYLQRWLRVGERPGSARGSCPVLCPCIEQPPTIQVKEKARCPGSDRLMGHP